MKSGERSTSLKQQIIDWIANNEATIKDICKGLQDAKASLCIIYDVEYHEDIRNEYRSRVVSAVRDAVCKDIGCSAEEFYETIEGKEEKWITLYSLD